MKELMRILENEEEKEKAKQKKRENDKLKKKKKKQKRKEKNKNSSKIEEDGVAPLSDAIAINDTKELASHSKVAAGKEDRDNDIKQNSLETENTKSHKGKIQENVVIQATKSEDNYEKIIDVIEPVLSLEEQKKEEEKMLPVATYEQNVVETATKTMYAPTSAATTIPSLVHEKEPVVKPPVCTIETEVQTIISHSKDHENYNSIEREIALTQELIHDIAVMLIIAL